MLDNHELLAVSNDTHLIPRALFGRDTNRRARLSPELFEQITGYKRFHTLGIDLPTALRHATRSTTTAGFISTLFDEYAERRHKPLAGEKDPEYVRRMRLIHQLFPRARVLHIIRDGRDVALSTLDWVTPERYLGRLQLWKEEPVAVCALWWKRQVMSGMEGGKSLGDRYFEVRYEQLVSDPKTTLGAVCDFLGIAFDPAMVRYHEGRTVASPKLSSKNRWLPPTNGIRNWRTSLPARDLKLFEALAGDTLQTLGYPLGHRTEECREMNGLADRYTTIWQSEIGSKVREI